MSEQALALLGSWGTPPDLPARLALVLATLLGLAAALGCGRSILRATAHPSRPARAEERTFLAMVGLGAALLSVAYLAAYLRGGPRIIDATSYFLQGRALSQGDLAWTPLEPSASFRGRFLIYRDVGPGAPSLGGIFPPGYPLLLAPFFWLGAPMLAGPLLAAGLVAATYQLARALAEETRPRLAEPIARAAALASLVCAALRYHTSDTMSHGASALGVAVALTLAVRSARQSAGQGRLEALFAGLAAGYVAATRPVSALPIGLVVAWLLGRSAGPRRVMLAALGALPGALLLLLSQRAVTGSWLESTQRLYYALSDGPAGCFRWGFGSGTGCIVEHGDFVAARLGFGFGPIEAAGTTLRRLHKHALDVANLEPLSLFVLVPALSLRRAAPRATLAASALVVLQILAYAPFYFDGDYPGGGARFFADVLPVEHALAILGVAHVASRSGRLEAFARAALSFLALSLAGFAVHGAFEHGKLRDRDGGRPMFEPDVLRRAGVTRGLVFVDTDHGFALAHDPHARPDTSAVVARRRGDSRDRLVYEALGRPPTWTYSFLPNRGAELTPWAPPALGERLRFEAEAEWPALSQEGGFAAPAWTADCASGHRALVVTPSTSRRAAAKIELPVPSKGRWAVEIHIVRGASVPAARAKLDSSPEGAITLGPERWTWGEGEACATLPERELALEPPRAVLTIEALGGPVALDAITLAKLP